VSGGAAGRLAGVTSYMGFFSGAATVAGALVGLLFVALSVAPERLRGDTASIEHQAIAATAFTALVDALFVALIGLQPGGGFRYGAVILGGLGLTSSCGLAARLWRARGTEPLSRRWPYLLSFIVGVYAAQVIGGFAVGSTSGQADMAVTFVYITFGIGISRSWELLGLRGGGPLDLLTQRLESGKSKPSATPGNQSVGQDPAPGAQ
jgi:hypothetical protein